jgi:hypothetical protein
MTTMNLMGGTWICIDHKVALCEAPGEDWSQRITNFMARALRVNTNPWRFSTSVPQQKQRHGFPPNAAEPPVNVKCMRHYATR